MKLPRWFWLAAFLVCWPTLLFGQTVIPLHVLERPEVTINLLPTPCVDPVSLDIAIRGLPPQHHKDLKALASNWLEKDGSRKDYAGCWLDIGGGFLVIFNDRTHDVIPKEVFRTTRGQVGI